jgi:hypothetical protein
MLPSWIPDLRFLTFGKSWLQFPEVRMACGDTDIDLDRPMYKPDFLHESENSPGRYLEGCGVQQFGRQSSYGDAPLHDVQSGYPSGDDIGSIKRSALVSLPANELRLVGRSVGNINIGREPAMADGYRFSGDDYH